jgi:Ring finger domain
VVGTDPLDSFEELAELLGHVKPQTATREDIDNSGLEVLRPNMLAEYEKIGRIAPMCVDRVRSFFCPFFFADVQFNVDGMQCLICLEDYNAEEDLRLLTCRHVFHRECVDRWLETGRNNCPACRSQVRTLNRNY